jgi:anti-sigma B factor antagonist
LLAERSNPPIHAFLGAIRFSLADFLRNASSSDKVPALTPQAPGTQRSTVLKIVERTVGAATILDITGDIDLASSPDLRKILLRELKEKRTPRVIVNLVAVRYIDSSGVASLVEGLKASRDSGMRFALVGLSKGAREVLQLSRLIKIFEIHDNEEQALA